MRPPPLGCTLDFARTTLDGEPEEGKDGNLVTEFVMMERLWQESTLLNTYDPYTCAVKLKPFLECLDIAGPRTLGSANSTVYDPSATSTVGGGNDVLALEATLNASSTVYFGAELDCSGKTVGDGVLNAYDLAVIMWYQLGSPPYDSLDRNPSVVPTVQGRDDTQLRCGLGETRTEWLLDVAEDYCVGVGEGEGRRRLEEDATPPSETIAWEAARMKDLEMVVTPWVSVPDQGRWLRLRAAGVQACTDSQTHTLDAHLQHRCASSPCHCLHTCMFIYMHMCMYTHMHAHAHENVHMHVHV